MNAFQQRNCVFHGQASAVAPDRARFQELLQRLARNRKLGDELQLPLDFVRHCGQVEVEDGGDAVHTLG